MSDDIQSERLDLVAMTPAFLRASLNGDLAEAARVLQRPLSAEWPGEHVDLLALRLRQLEADPAVQPWLLRAMVLRLTGEMVGHIGFHTEPGPEYLAPYAPGAVEFGLTVYSQFRRRGFAREASVALMRWATEEQGATRFVMSIRPDNEASQSLARQLGFVRISSHIDEMNGEEDILERVVIANHAPESIE